FVAAAPGAQTGAVRIRLTNTLAATPDGDAVALPAPPIMIRIENGSGPSIPGQAVLNAADLLPGPISPGEIVPVFGSTPTDPELLINGIKAPLLYADPVQLNAVVPFGLDPSAPAKLEVRSRDQAGATLSMPVGAATPAIFTLSGTGIGPGAILNEDYSVNS